MKDQAAIGLHNFNLTPQGNGGEALVLNTVFYANGDKITETEGVVVNQVLTLQSYGKSAWFNLYTGCLTPAMLRKCADQLEQAEIRARLFGGGNIKS